MYPEVNEISATSDFYRNDNKHCPARINFMKAHIILWVPIAVRCVDKKRAISITGRGGPQG
jgi:hypothetical protein